MTRPLEGIRVLDLTAFVAAPVCARLLSDLGAEVIKVERPQGDAWRGVGKSYNRRFGDDQNPVFDIYNSGKKMIALDLKTEKGKEIFWKLLKESDVFVTNTRPDALKRLGFSYEEVKKECPQLIYAMVIGYGEKGPEAAVPAFDTTAFWARTGFLRDMAVKNEGYEPLMPPSSIGDTVTGTTLGMEICAALFRRSRTGKGDYVTSSLYHNGIFAMGTMTITTQQPGGQILPRTRRSRGLIGTYRCSDDEWVLLANGGNPAYFSRIIEMLGLTETIKDPRFATPEERAKPENFNELYQIFTSRFLEKPAEEWVKLAAAADVPLVRMNHFEEVNSDPQAWANGFLENVTFRTGDQMPMPNSPIRMASVGELKTVPAPTVGWDTKEVLEDLGYTAEEIQKMAENGEIKTRE